MEDGGGLSGDHLRPPQLPAPDEGRDLLTCGQCGRAFPLAHILAFIQHKQGGCGSRGGAADTGAAPPSPANRVRRQQAAGAEPGPGFIELRRGGARERVWVEEPGMSKPGKGVKAQPGGRLLLSDCLLFFIHPRLYVTVAPPSSRVQLINWPLPLAEPRELVTLSLIVWRG